MDDEPQILQMSRGVLEAQGYRVLTADNGSSALALYTQYRGEVRVVVTDMMMPTTDGPSMIRAIRQLDPDVPFINVSGLLPEAEAISSVCAFLLKPYEAHTLLKAIDRALRPS